MLCEKQGDDQGKKTASITRAPLMLTQNARI